MPNGVYICAQFNNLNWRTALMFEFDALRSNHSLYLVPRPHDVNMITAKWVFKHKLHSDGSLERYKVHSELSGFTPCSGVDINETFSSIVKPATIHTVLTVALPM
jgi:hypothetical protein